MAESKVEQVSVKYTGQADIRILPKNDLADKAGAEHDRLRFAKDNDWTLPVSQPVADWLVANDAFELV